MKDKSTLLSAIALILLGIAVGAVSNLTAGPARRLEWARDYPDPEPGKKHCPDTLPEPGAASAPVAATVPPAPATSEPVPVPMAEPAGTSLAMTEPPGAAEPASAPAGATVAAVASAPVAKAPTSVAPPPAPAATAPPAPAPAAVTVPPVPPDAKFVELTPAQVDLLYDQGALFVDARITSSYEDGHVANAISIAIWESGVDQKIEQAIFNVEGDKTRPIVVYCNGGNCEDSHNLSGMFWEQGFTSMYVYKDGYPDWLARGRPVRKGSTP